MLIRREDFNDIDKLTRGSNKKIWFVCNECGIGVLRSYKTYIKKNEDLCRACQNKKTANREDVKQKHSERQKNKWDDPEYRDKVIPKLSQRRYDYWNSVPPEKRVSKNKRSYKTLKQEVESKGFYLLTERDDWEKIPNIKPKVICPLHPEMSFYFRKNSGCPFCTKTKMYLPEWKKELEEINYILKDINNKEIQFICDKEHDCSLKLVNWRKGYRCPFCAENRKYWKDIVNEIKDLGWSITSDIDFRNIKTKTKLTLQCKDCGDIIEKSYLEIKRLKRCDYCYKLERYNQIKKEFEQEGYTLLTPFGQNEHNIHHDYYKFKCPIGHIHTIFLGN